MKKLMVGLLIAVGLLVMACESSPTLLPTGTATVTPATSAGAAVGSTPPASAAAAVSPTPTATKAAHVLLLSEGTYVVGTAIPAGTYQGQSLSENSHYQIATDPNGKNIVAESPPLTGQFDLKLKKGQYLEVSGVMKITKVN